ncbi:MAG: sirohydrochlorin chelatase [Anaerolineae bacterium]|nr:sirohydrochlorin chelatase [Anaerolineae bacterium]
MTPVPQNTQNDALLLIGHGSRDAEAITEYNHFADTLAGRLQIPVYPCFLEFADPPIVEGIRACVEAGARRVVALPLFLGPAGHQKNDVPAILNWAKTQWPQVQFKYGVPLGAQPQIISVLAQRAAEAIAGSRVDIPAAETALLVVGRGSRDPDSNSEVYKIARLLWEGRYYGWVESAFYSLTTPTVPAALERCLRLGARRVVVLPYLLFTGAIYQRMGDQARAVQTAQPDAEILVAEHLSEHPEVIEAVVYRYQEVLEGTASMTCDLCKYRHRLAGFEDEYGLAQVSDHHHGLRGVPHTHSHPHSHGQNYEQTLEMLLPPRYQQGQEASPVPMAAAPLKYNAEGQVAWDEIWADFCDLALAGGPAHRGDLLEPVLPGAVAENPQGYERVLAELERGFRLVTGVPVVRSQSPGWIGLECDSEQMALWLLRAIVTENVSVRREGKTLFLPAGPDFRLEDEIKNVITVVAKTYHYWSEHIVAING